MDHPSLLVVCAPPMNSALAELAQALSRGQLDHLSAETRSEIRNLSSAARLASLGGLPGPNRGQALRFESVTVGGGS